MAIRGSHFLSCGVGKGSGDERDSSSIRTGLLDMTYSP